MINYLYLVLIVLGLNLMPAFAPPTWSVLVLFRLNSHLAPIPLVILGAISAGSGRYLLALGSGKFRSKISAKQLANIEAAGELITRGRKSAVAIFILFTLSPLPSAQLFEAAGLIGKRLITFTLAFFAGRLVSYSLYVAGASQLKDRNLGEIFTSSLTSPWAITLEVISLAGIYAMTQINWKRFHPTPKK